MEFFEQVLMFKKSFFTTLKLADLFLDKKSKKEKIRILHTRSKSITFILDEPLLFNKIIHQRIVYPKKIGLV